MLLAQTTRVLGSGIFVSLLLLFVHIIYAPRLTPYSKQAASILSSAWASSPLASRQTGIISWFACPDNDKTQCAFFDVPRDVSAKIAQMLTITNALPPSVFESYGQ